MTPLDRREKLRAILAGQHCVTAASLFDPMTARIADDLGFEVGLMGGSVASFAVLGAPDLIVLTLTELAEQARRVCRAGRLCVMVDADHGYGNALNVMRTVEELGAAGVSALTIEDTLLPRAYGATDAAQLIAIDEGIGKMKAAVDASRQSKILVLGRTSAATLTSVDDAIRRLRAYESAGVDALMVPGLKTREQLDRIADAVKLPLIIGGPAEELADPAYLASRRTRVWMSGHFPFAAAVQAMYDTAKAMKENVLGSKMKGLAPKPLMDRLTNASAYDAATKKFLG